MKLRFSLQVRRFLPPFVLVFFLVHQGAWAAPVVDYSRTPILFVHGHGLNAESWKNLSDYLVRHAGYPPEYLLALNIVPNTMGNKKAARKFIRPAVEKLLQRANALARRNGYTGDTLRRVNIVAHSMGAMSSRWYVARERPERVRAWVSVAGANHGTNALCEYEAYDAGSADMCPAFASSRFDSSIQVALNGKPGGRQDETPYGVGADRPEAKRVPPTGEKRVYYFTVRIEPDRWIKPENSAVIDGAGGVVVETIKTLPFTETSPGNFLYRGYTDHDSLTKETDLFQFIEALFVWIDRLEQERY